MSTIKTNIDPRTFNLIINQLSPFLPEKPEVLPIKGGEISQAYELVSSDSKQSLILRINNRDDEGFWKDNYAYTHFLENGVEIPKIIENGQYNKYFYSLSEKCVGKLLDTLDVSEGELTQKDLFGQLLKIYSIEPMGSGYGTWDKTLNASNLTMQDLIMHDLRVEPIDLIQRDFTNLELHESIRQKALALKDYAIEERYLIHGDIGYNNTCGHEGKVTGIFDWAESGYGDFVLDIAWLMFWNEDALKSGVRFREYYDSLASDEKPALNFANYDKRIEYNLLAIGYGSLCFFAKTENPESYKYVTKVLKNWNLI